MRKILLTLLLLSIIVTLAACRLGEPQIEVETVQLDLGDVPNGQIATHNVAVRNDGDALLVIEDISTSCGCTTATLEPAQLAPGERGTLQIAVDTGAHGPALTGPLVRNVFVNSNDPAQPEVSIEVAVNVTPPQVTESD